MSLIECSGLTRRYGSTVAISNLDLTLQSGAPIALIGPNGAGKTTLLSMLCGFIQPSSGTVRILGSAPGSSGVHGRLAALPQDAQLDPRFSVQQQLQLMARLQGMGKKQGQLEVSRVLDKVQLTDAQSKKPDELSHGMRKRIAIAQLLLGEPELALLDEPTAGLDPPNVKIIRDLINSTADKTTYVISSHNLDELEKMCESVVYLDKGVLREHRSISDLDDNESYLTVRIQSVDADEFLAACESLPGVTGVSHQQQGAFVISYDAVSNPALDIRLMELMNARGWSYKNLSKGRSLEDKLFQQE